MFTLYAIKIAWQYQYFRMKENLKKADFFEAWNIKMKNERDRKLRYKSIMAFPLMFPMEMENEKYDLEEIKKRIKRIHIGLYILIMVIMILGIYSSKAYPNGIFSQ